jgi:hypothetical protein
MGKVGRTGGMVVLEQYTKTILTAWRKVIHQFVANFLLIPFVADIYPDAFGLYLPQSYPAP